MADTEPATSVPAESLDEDDWNLPWGHDEDGHDTSSTPVVDAVPVAAVAADDDIADDVGVGGDDEDAADAAVAEPVAAVADAALAADEKDEEEEQTVAPEAVESKAAAPPTAPPSLPPVTSTTTAPPAPVATPSYTAPPRSTPASTSSGTCPVICPPGLKTLWRWMTWQETTPGVVILTSAVALYALHLQGWSCTTIGTLVLMAAIVGGLLVKVHNHFMDETTHIHIPKINSKDIGAAVGQHAGIVTTALLSATVDAARWDNTKRSVQFLAHLWLLSRFSCLLFSPTFLVVCLFAMFFGPMGWEMVREQANAAYAKSVKPLLTPAVMKLHTVFANVHDMPKNKLGLAGAGAVAVLFLVWRLMSSFFSLWSIITSIWTLSALCVVSDQHARAFGCPGAAGAADGKKKEQ